LNIDTSFGAQLEYVEKRIIQHLEIQQCPCQVGCTVVVFVCRYHISFRSGVDDAALRGRQPFNVELQDMQCWADGLEVAVQLISAFGTQYWRPLTAAALLHLQIIAAGLLST
jgi:hypothetical protein